MKDFSPWLLERAELLVISATTQAYDAAELAELRGFMERGGHVILAVGWEEKSQSLQALLDLIGLDLLRIPLGPEPVIRQQEHLDDRAQFVNA